MSCCVLRNRIASFLACVRISLVRSACMVWEHQVTTCLHDRGFYSSRCRGSVEHAPTLPARHLHGMSPRHPILSTVLYRKGKLPLNVTVCRLHSKCVIVDFFSSFLLSHSRLPPTLSLSVSQSFTKPWILTSWISCSSPQYQLWGTYYSCLSKLVHCLPRKGPLSGEQGWWDHPK